jgi:hypothetical protein
LVLQENLRRLVQNAFGARINLNTHRSRLSSRSCSAPLRKLSSRLEQEFQSELNESRIRPLGRGRDHSEILIVGRAANCVWWGELSSVEDVEELGAQLKTKPLVCGESRYFEQCEIKIVNSLGTQPRIDTLLVPKSKISGRCKTRCIEPSWGIQFVRAPEPRSRAAGC